MRSQAFLLLIAFTACSQEGVEQRAPDGGPARGASVVQVSGEDGGRVVASGALDTALAVTTRPPDKLTPDAQALAQDTQGVESGKPDSGVSADVRTNVMGYTLEQILALNPANLCGSQVPESCVLTADWTAWECTGQKSVRCPDAGSRG